MLTTYFQEKINFKFSQAWIFTNFLTNHIVFVERIISKYKSMQHCCGWLNNSWKFGIHFSWKHVVNSSFECFLIEWNEKEKCTASKSATQLSFKNLKLVSVSWINSAMFMSPLRASRGAPNPNWGHLKNAEASQAHRSLQQEKLEKNTFISASLSVTQAAAVEFKSCT